MQNIRLIARLDVKAPYLVKGVHLEGLRKLGDPETFATKYYLQGADEILYLDSVASLYERNTLLDVIEKTVQNTFIPITVGGGIRTFEDAKKVLRAGADKVAINSAALKNPRLLSEISYAFGAQCVVLSVQAKSKPQGGWEAYYDNGREHSGRDVLKWVSEAEKYGIGEILLTSIDQDGTRKGFDIALYQAVVAHVNVPVIASGGMWDYQHLSQLLHQSEVSAVAMGSCLHYNHLTIDNIKHQASLDGIPMRTLPVTL